MLLPNRSRADWARHVSLLAAVAGLHLGGCRAAPTAAPDLHRSPVLLIHGLGENADVWLRMRMGLEARGYPAEYLLAVELVPSGGANIPAATEQLASAVERLLARATNAASGSGVPAPSRVDLIAHSMGALSGRYYAAQVRPDRVRTLLTLAGANHGSDRFCPPADPPGSRELCPAFASGPPDGIQALLNGTGAAVRDETPYGLGADPEGRPSTPADSSRRIRYATIDAGREEWIVPTSSTRLAGAGGWDSSVTLPKGVLQLGTGSFVITRSDHDAIVRSEAAIALVAALLASGR